MTKYINDSRDKIQIIIEELTTSYIYEDNLMSFLNSKVELIDYKEENDVTFEVPSFMSHRLKEFINEKTQDIDFIKNEQ